MLTPHPYAAPPRPFVFHSLWPAFLVSLFVAFRPVPLGAEMSQIRKAMLYLAHVTGWSRRDLLDLTERELFEWATDANTLMVEINRPPSKS